MRRRRVPGVLAPVGRQWRRSLTLRVVASTLVVSSIVVGVLGFVLLDQVGHGLLNAKRKASLAEFAAGISNAQSQLDQTDATDSSALEPVLEAIVNQLSTRGNGVYSVALLPTSLLGTGFDSGETGITIPARIRAEVVDNQAEVSSYVRIPRDAVTSPGGGAGATYALVVGAPVAAPTTTDTYELYFVFPLRTEQQTLNLVERTLLAGGGVLMLLLAVITALVTRLVVTPVRAAARAASRLADGLLDERIRVRGEDDLARLGRSFNEMAGRLQEQISRLEELSRVQQRFTSDVSHELRTPLTTVRMAADILYDARADFPPVVARSAELLIGELARFESLLIDLLEISRHDAGAAMLEVTEVDIGALVRSEVHHANYLAAQRGCSIDIVAAPAEALIAEADSRRIARILRNLLANAIEHGDGAPVEISMGASTQAVAITVRDYGKGLRPGDAERVFRRFWRADLSRARGTGGSGLGLAIALEDARLHGGSLQAWGRPAQGAAFRLVLPRTPNGPLGRPPLELTPPEAELRR